MKRKRFSVEQITTVLRKQSRACLLAIFAARSAFPSRASRRWRKVYGNLQPSEARELKPLRDEYKKLKRLVADLSLDKGMLQDVLSKKF